MTSTTDIQAYDVASFCRAYGVSRSFAYLEIKAGRLAIFKAGRRTLIARDAADAWRRACEAATQAARAAAPERGAGEAR
ncbi:MAG: hypothetical protein NW206_17330 [Hyphomonadaceae bacterium]|nr:hypothetical protein [Hyphomonadaceae bacterium]